MTPRTRVLVTGLVTLLLLTTAHSFLAQAGTHYAGFRAGVNVSTLKGDEPADLESVQRPLAGFVGVFELTPWLAFQPEVLWSGKGARGDLPIRFGSITSVKGELTLDYLELPLLLRFRTKPFGRWRPYASGGPGVAANLAADVDVEEITGGSISPTSIAQVERIITDGDLFLVAGAGIGVSFGQLVLEGDARYSAGLLSVEETGRSVDPKNRTWAFSLAVLFGPSVAVR
jgi:hypothetical protein